MTWGLHHCDLRRESQSLILKMGERVGLQSFLLVPSVFVLSSAFAFFPLLLSCFLSM